ncbi:MAG: CHASE domain-containing protein [Gallionella sp.]
MLKLIFNRRNLISWMILAAGVLLTVLVAQATQRQIQGTALQQFNVRVDDVMSSIQSRMRQQEQILLGGAGLFDASKSVSRDAWHAYVTRLDLDKNYPGILGVGYSQIIQPQDLSSHIKRIRTEGFPQYTVRPPGERPIYTSIIYLEPFSGRNLAAFGYDMMSEATRAKAMRLAVETGMTTISGKVKLVQETHGKVQAGFLMYVPIFAKGLPPTAAQQKWQAIKGFVYSPFRMDDLMQGMMFLRGNPIDFSIFDGDSADSDSRMYDSGEDAAGQSRQAEFNELRRIELYGHSWTVSLHSSSNFEADYESSLGSTILWMGSGISLLLFFLVSLQIFHREQAEQLAQDITVDLRLQRNELQENEERFRYMLETCPTAARISRRGNVLFFNTRYLKLTDTTPENAYGMDPASYYVDPDIYAGIVRRLDNGEQVFDQLVELHKPGDPETVTKWALASFLIIQYQGKPAVLGWFHDITERIRIDKMKSEFISTVSHELRTPLTSIVGSLGLIAGGALGELPAQAKNMIEIAHRNSLRLSLLINDLLDMEKLAEGKMEFKMQLQKLMPLIKQALEDNQGYGNARNVRLELTGRSYDAMVNVDAHRLMQVLSNLLSNAIKYSPDNGTVEVAVQNDQQKVRITVTDRGPGIPAEFRSWMFQKFSQADSSDTRQKGGTGLGLAIVRELVERMGGEIGFDSVEGQGASFYVEFPVA